MGYFLINEDVVDRNDLNLEEKMACVVLARYADIKVLQALLSLDIIAVKMGCSIERAKAAIDGLIGKGVLKSTQPKTGHILTKSKAEQIPAYVYQALGTDHEAVSEQTSVDAKLKGIKQAADVSQVAHQAIKIDGASIQALKDYFEEIVSESHIRLLLNLTKGNVDAIKKAYEQCRVYPPNKRIEKLADLLQGAETPITAKAAPQPIKQPDLFKNPVGEAPKPLQPRHEVGETVKNEDYDALFQELGDSQEIKQLNQQINVKRIKQMYGAYGKKP